MVCIDILIHLAMRRGDVNIRIVLCCVTWDDLFLSLKHLFNHRSQPGMHAPKCIVCVHVFKRVPPSVIMCVNET